MFVCIGLVRLTIDALRRYTRFKACIKGKKILKSFTMIKLFSQLGSSQKVFF